MVHLLVSELLWFQNARCNDKKKMSHVLTFACLLDLFLDLSAIYFSRFLQSPRKFQHFEIPGCTIIILSVDRTLFCRTSCMQQGVEFPYQSFLK